MPINSQNYGFQEFGSLNIAKRIYQNQQNQNDLYLNDLVNKKRDACQFVITCGFYHMTGKCLPFWHK